MSFCVEGLVYFINLSGFLCNGFMKLHNVQHGVEMFEYVQLVVLKHTLA